MLLPVLAGCGVPPPTEDDGRHVIEAKISDDGYTAPSRNRLKVVNFHKTAGRAGAGRGGPSYEMDYECVILVAEDCLWVKEMGLMTDSSSDPKGVGTPVKKGDRTNLWGMILFTKLGARWYSTGFSCQLSDIP